MSFLLRRQVAWLRDRAKERQREEELFLGWPVFQKHTNIFAYTQKHTDRRGGRHTQRQVERRTHAVTHTDRRREGQKKSERLFLLVSRLPVRGIYKRRR